MVGFERHVLTWTVLQGGTALGRTGLPGIRWKAIFKPQMTLGHMAILLKNIWGSVNKKLCFIRKNRIGSVFHGLSQDAKVFRCPCNSWPSGLSGNARLPRMGAFSRVPGLPA